MLAVFYAAERRGLLIGERGLNALDSINLSIGYSIQGSAAAVTA
jgi:hypothetical protein